MAMGVAFFVDPIIWLAVIGSHRVGWTVKMRIFAERRTAPPSNTTASKRLNCKIQKHDFTV